LKFNTRIEIFIHTTKNKCTILVRRRK